MAYFDTTISTHADPGSAFRYLADFSNAAEWDPSVPRAIRLDEGPIEAGARFRVELALGSRSLPLVYTLERCEPERLLVFRADEPWFRSLDTIELTPRSDGTLIRYDADLRLDGLAFLLDPVVHLGFQVSGTRSADGLRRALDALPRHAENPRPRPRAVPDPAPEPASEEDDPAVDVTAAGSETIAGA
ncbi:MAG: SRPBCC family protein [Myxococcota bacterium]